MRNRTKSDINTLPARPLAAGGVGKIVIIFRKTVQDNFFGYPINCKENSLLQRDELWLSSTLQDVGRILANYVYIDGSLLRTEYR